MFKIEQQWQVEMNSCWSEFFNCTWFDSPYFIKTLTTGNASFCHAVAHTGTFSQRHQQVISDRKDREVFKWVVDLKAMFFYFPPLELPITSLLPLNSQSQHILKVDTLLIIILLFWLLFGSIESQAMVEMEVRVVVSVSNFCLLFLRFSCTRQQK